jgi:hypothetical protein
MTSPVALRHVVAGTVAALFALTSLAGCGGDDDGTGADTTRGGPEVANVVGLGVLLNEAGIPCDLEYEGLVDDRREVSICQIDGGQATLTVWDDTTALDRFMTEPMSGPGATVVGPNWTIDVANPRTAERLALALEAEVRTPGDS